MSWGTRDRHRGDMIDCYRCVGSTESEVPKDEPVRDAAPELSPR
jgi:hypothetical protein